MVYSSKLRNDMLYKPYLLSVASFFQKSKYPASNHQLVFGFILFS